MDFWTSVPVSNDFAAAVISAYLEKDHLLMCAFDADIMLDDLVAPCGIRSRLCTPFFVCSLMLVACVGAARLLPSPQSWKRMVVYQDVG